MVCIPHVRMLDLSLEKEAPLFPTRERSASFFQSKCHMIRILFL